MKISQKEVRRVAQLARLELDEAEVLSMTGQLDAILQYVAKLDELDTSGVKPTVHTWPACNAFREDEMRPSLPREVVLANAPEQNGASFVVPRIIG